MICSSNETFSPDSLALVTTKVIVQSCSIIFWLSFSLMHDACLWRRIEVDGRHGSLILDQDQGRHWLTFTPEQQWVIADVRVPLHQFTSSPLTHEASSRSLLLRYHGSAVTAFNPLPPISCWWINLWLSLSMAAYRSGCCCRSSGSMGLWGWSSFMAACVVYSCQSGSSSNPDWP